MDESLEIPKVKNLMDAEVYIQQIRSTYPVLDNTLLDRVRIEGLEKISAEVSNTNTFRHEVIEKLKHDLTESDLPLVRFLMQQEIICEENWDMPACRSEDFETVAQMLSYLGQVEDIPLLWEAKCASFDTSFVIDAAYFFTNGFDEAIEYVKQLQIEDRHEILEYLVDNLEDVKGWFDVWFQGIRSRFARDEN